MAMMKKLTLVLAVSLSLGIAASVVAAYAQQIDRTQLPFPDTQYKDPGKGPLSARDAKFPPIKPLRPPEGSPTLVAILLADVGVGDPGTFGGGGNIRVVATLPEQDLGCTSFLAVRLRSPC